MFVESAQATVGRGLIHLVFLHPTYCGLYCIYSWLLLLCSVCVCERVCVQCMPFSPHWPPITNSMFKRASSSRHVPENVAVSCIGNSVKHEYQLSSADVQLPLISKGLSKTVVHCLGLISRGFKGLPSYLPTIRQVMPLFGGAVTCTVLRGYLATATADNSPNQNVLLAIGCSYSKSSQ